MIFTGNNNAKNKLYRGKSTKKLFTEKINLPYGRVMSPQNKKLFPHVSHQKFTIQDIKSSKTFVKIDVNFFKIQKNFGKPTKEVIIQNDRKKLLSSEFKEKYNKSFTNQISTYLLNIYV